MHANRVPTQGEWHCLKCQNCLSLCCTSSCCSISNTILCSTNLKGNSVCKEAPFVTVFYSFGLTAAWSDIQVKMLASACCLGGSRLKRWYNRVQWRLLAPVAMHQGRGYGKAFMLSCFLAINHINKGHWLPQIDCDSRSQSPKADRSLLFSSLTWFLKPWVIESCEGGRLVLMQDLHGNYTWTSLGKLLCQCTVKAITAERWEVYISSENIRCISVLLS